MASMTDRTNIVTKIMQALYTSSTTFTITPGTGGGSAFTVTPPFFLRLMATTGSNTANGTELSAATGYTALGSTMGATAFGAPSAGVSASSNAVSWTAGAAWPTVNGAEVWDSAATKLRYLQGAITAFTLANGNTVNFAVGAVTADASQW